MFENNLIFTFLGMHVLENINIHTFQKISFKVSFKLLNKHILNRKKNHCLFGPNKNDIKLTFLSA